ncbi:hypothetical protein FIU87_11105 [Bacillus sp. THAF10]|uniref:hypothetical protein n=1 Tax=Bacillus sp. THAF10 TaxID=2587848 RepID=UPI001268F094|nr:hypothetical protein [Bacillus sp. THAF10]QFT89196.1 hypothetical protein FIU87_11105 [Bacillus sp. THAF10]
MNHYDFEKVIYSLTFFKEELAILLDYLELYEQADHPQKQELHVIIASHFKRFKDELKKEIKILVQYDANMLVSDYLLPTLSVVFIYLQEIGVNRINPNSIKKVLQQIRKAYLFLERYHEDLLSHNKA